MFLKNIIKERKVKKDIFNCAKDEYIAKFYIRGMKYLFENQIWCGSVTYYILKSMKKSGLFLAFQRVTLHIQI